MAAKSWVRDNQKSGIKNHQEKEKFLKLVLKWLSELCFGIFLFQPEFIYLFIYLFIYIQRCIQSTSLHPRTHSFFFWTQRILNKGSNWTRQKIECLCKLQTPGKSSVTRYANLCVMKTIFINWLTLYGLFHCKFSD